MNEKKHCGKRRKGWHPAVKQPKPLSYSNIIFSQLTAMRRKIDKKTRCVYETLMLLKHPSFEKYDPDI